MKRILSVCLLLAAFASVAGAQCFPFPQCGYFPHGTLPLYVQGNIATQHSGTTAVVSLSAVGANHGLIVWCAANANCNTPTATGETFTTFTGTSGCQNSGASIQCWLAATTAGGEASVTCSTVAAATINCAVIEFTRPLQLATPKDAGGNGNVSSGTSFSVSTSAATTVSTDFVAGCSVSGGGSGAATVTSAGWTQPAALNFADANSVMACGYITTSSTGIQTMVGNMGSATFSNASVLAVKP